MPRYFFNLSDGTYYADEDGQDLPSANAARDVAMETARGIMADEVKTGELNLQEKILISDADGQIVTTIAFRDAVRITGE